MPLHNFCSLYFQISAENKSLLLIISDNAIYADVGRVERESPK